VSKLTRTALFLLVSSTVNCWAIVVFKQVLVFSSIKNVVVVIIHANAERLLTCCPYYLNDRGELTRLQLVGGGGGSVAVGFVTDFHAVFVEHAERYDSLYEHALKSLRGSASAQSLRQGDERSVDSCCEDRKSAVITDTV
jgi:hypothetical protein